MIPRLILLPSDLSSESLHSLAGVVPVARALGAEILLLHVVLELDLPPLGVPLSAPIQSARLEDEVRNARCRLDEQRQVLGADLVRTTEVIRAPDVARAVVQYAKEQGCDWIALSTHGRTGWRHLVLGSIAEAILRHSEVPVLSFPLPKA